MKKEYVIVTDSNSELPLQFAKEHNVDYVPMPYVLDENEVNYHLGEFTDFKAFYDKVREGKLPQTSTYPPEYYVEKLSPYLESGQDILFISFSSQLSSAFSYLSLACEQLRSSFPKRKIITIDTLRISAPMALLVMDAIKEYENGMPMEELAKWIDDNKLKYRVFFMVDDINHLKRGGRISPAVAAIGTMLSIKPILIINDEGQIVKFGSEKGRKKAISKIAELVNENIVDDKNATVLIVHADSIQDADLLKNAACEKIHCENIMMQNIGPVIGTHCGPGTLALAYKAKN
ncbi:MAG: DegV family protein [Clostridia bacterium]|nr:DegV family protein [Clostridia bacterium]